MKIIIKYLKPYWKTVIVIALLLAVMAFCDLALPQYTSEIIDVGITNRGVDHILPEQILPEDYETARTFMTPEEAAVWEDSYEPSGESSVLIRKAQKEEELDRRDAILQVPVLMNYMAASGMQPEADMAALRARVEAMEETMGSSLLFSMGSAYAAGCDERAGMDMNHVQMAYMWRVGLKMLLITLLMLITPIMISYLASGVGASMGRNLRRQIFHKVIGFSNNEIDRFSTASLITRSTNDIQQIQMVVVAMLRLLLYAPIIGAGGIYKVVRTHSHMEWIIILGVAAILLLVTVLMRIALPKFRIMQSLIDNLNLVSREILTGLPVIRAFGREQEEEARFRKANIDLTGTQLFTSRTMVFMGPGMSIIMYGITLLIVWVSARRIDAGTLQIGTMTAFITYSMLIVMSFLMLTALAIMVPRAGVAAERIEEVLRTESSITELPEEQRSRADDSTQKGTVVFEQVAFRYPDSELEVLSDISFTAKPGETTAIIGSTGCGKSTLVNLIPRFYDVTAGRILVGGTDIREMGLKELRDRIGFVPQKGVLFSGTVASNLRFGDEEAGEEEMKQAAATAQALEFIESKPEGLEAPIAQGGTNVSGGQKQRLAIARALIRKPEIMIFDDSFSALDMKTDTALRRALNEELHDSTVIIVAQRISTIIHADQILVLEQGKIAGIGTHEQLLQTCDVYREIASSQLSAAELGIREEV